MQWNKRKNTCDIKTHIPILSICSDEKKINSQRSKTANQHLEAIHEDILLNEQVNRRQLLQLLQYTGIICENTKAGVSSPTTACFISLFQFYSKTPVANKSASSLVSGTDFLVTVCKYSEVACIKAATQKEFPPKKKKKEWWGGEGWRGWSRTGSALRNKNGFHASHIWGPQCWSHVQSF